MLLGELGNINLPASSVEIQEFGSENIFLYLNRNSYVSDRYHITVHATGYYNDCLHVFSDWRAAPAAFCLQPALLWNNDTHWPPFRPRPTRPVCTILLLILISGDIEINPGPTGTNNFEFGCFNVRSAVRKAASLHDIIHDHKLNILALSETWIPGDAPPAIAQDMAPDGFGVLHTHRTNTGGRSRGGGLALIYDKRMFTAQPVKPKPVAHFLTFEFQLVKISSGRKSFLIANLYRPSSSALSELFFEQLSDLLTSLISTSTDHIVVCGDLNCPGTDQSSVDPRLDDIFETFGLNQHVRQATRENNLLDILATHSTLVVKNVRVDDAGMVSDHRLIIATLQMPVTPIVPAVPVASRRINNIDLEKFQASLRESALFTNPSTTVDGFAQQIQDIVTEELDKVAPLKITRRRPSKPITKFLSPAAKSAKRERRRRERTWKSTNLESDRVAYRRSCRTANRLINESRTDFMRDRLTESTDPKQKWRTVKDLLHSNSTDSILPDDECTSLCARFSDFFVSKIQNLKRAILDKANLIINMQPFQERNHSGPKLDTLPPVTPDEVKKLLSSIPGKSCPLDFIPTSLIKSCSNVFSEIISTLANLSFTEGRFPAAFKQAFVTPLLKKPDLDKSDPSSYRPISNLNNISKLLERLFLARFQPHVTSSPNFNPLQSAYRRFHSTETSLLNTFDQVYTAADASKPTLLVSLDLSAAFDTIDHPTLLSRLEIGFGVSGSALDWIRSYLVDRVQRVVVGQAKSATTSLSTGVPQGSVLGPLLFSTFTSPVGHIISSMGIHHQQYADDTQLFISLNSSDQHISVGRLEQCLLRLHEWFCVNGLALNPDKSEAIWLSTYQRIRTFPPHKSVDVAGSTVKITDNLKTLGVTLDSRLALDHHVSLICKSCFFHIRAFRHIRPALTQDMAKSVAVSLVGSRLDYANALLYGTSMGNLHKLQRIQNTLAKLVCPGHTHSSDALRILHWLPIRQRIDFKIATLTFKLLNFGSPAYLACLLKPYLPVRALRSHGQQLLVRPHVKSSIGSRAFRVAAPTVWNSLPLPIRLSPSIDIFRRELKTYLFTMKT